MTVVENIVHRHYCFGFVVAGLVYDGEMGEIVGYGFSAFMIFYLE